MFGLLRRGAAFAAIAATSAVVLAGCGSDIKGDHADLVHGKQLFVQRCGACHTLARAGARGTVGPDLDAAFARSLQDGFGRSVVTGIVKQQILYPERSGKMPAQLVTGQGAVDIAAYVAASVANPGQDTGALASAVRTATPRTAAAQGGKLEIDANPDGQLAYQVSSATAPAGALQIASRNAASIPHDIALQQGTNGPVLATGTTVSNGGVSTISVNVRPGRYTFYCTLPGHRQAGMQGTLTVR
ncbi:MAG TPA: plastocyanin/azurin family copper-binding protein [Conexibacter sp.]|jgi:mono/diheme cytochrome c family protein|nr:plastocyanin/azurin family copper-binding protein [Conexibacter sp.]